jgi:multiple antibiotic resistance protein
MDIEFFKTALVTMFVAVDPPGLIPIFLALTAQMSAAQRKFVTYRSALIAFTILAASAWGAKALLEALNIGIPAFRIAGGILLFIIAVEMVFDRREARKESAARSEENMHEAPRRIAVFPLAIPMMAGPGAITAIILQADATGGDLQNMLALMGVLVIVIASCVLVFISSGRLNRFMGITGRVVLSRLLGVVLAALAIQIIGDGIKAFGF